MGRLKVLAFLSVAVFGSAALAPTAPANAESGALETKSILVRADGLICIEGTYESKTDEPVSLNAQVATRGVQNSLVRLAEADGTHLQTMLAQLEPCSPSQADLIVRVHTLIDRRNDRVSLTLTASGRGATYTDTLRRDHAEAWGMPKTNIIDPPIPADLWPYAASTAIRLDAQTLTVRLYRSLIIQKAIGVQSRPIASPTH